MSMTENSCLVLIDVQEKLAAVMDDKAGTVKNIEILLQIAKVLQIPVLWCQQYPEALGATLPELTPHLEGLTPVDKFSFSCFGERAFAEAVKKLKPEYAFVCGIEAHVCVYQTVLDFLERDIEVDVQVVADAVTSRTAANKQIAVDRMRESGATITSTEMLLFELLKTAKHEKFKELAKLIR